MKKAAFTFQVLKYSHDPAVGELLNIGVVLYCPDLEFIGMQAEHKFERLSTAFAGFDGESYRYALRRFESAVDRFCERFSYTLIQPLPKDVSEVTTELWPDQDLSIKLGPVLAGVTDQPEQALAQVFERMVLSQYRKEEKTRRSDDEVWAVYKKPLLDRQIASVLTAASVTTPEFSIEFDHAFRNERLHVLQPLSFDLVRSDHLQRKATQWLGTGTALDGHREIGRIVFLLGKPELTSMRPAYEKAKNLLHKIPVKHEIVEENEAEEFASSFSAFVKDHL